MIVINFYINYIIYKMEWNYYFLSIGGLKTMTQYDLF